MAPLSAENPRPILELVATRIASNLFLVANFPHARLLTTNDTPAALKGRGAAWSSDLAEGEAQATDSGEAHRDRRVLVTPCCPLTSAQIARPTACRGQQLRQA